MTNTNWRERFEKKTHNKWFGMTEHQLFHLHDEHLFESVHYLESKLELSSSKLLNFIEQEIQQAELRAKIEVLQEVQRDTGISLMYKVDGEDIPHKGLEAVRCVEKNHKWRLEKRIEKLKQQLNK